MTHREAEAEGAQLFSPAELAARLGLTEEECRAARERASARLRSPELPSGP